MRSPRISGALRRAIRSVNSSMLARLGFSIRPSISAISVLMFLTGEQRAELLRRLRLACKPGGAIIVFDKCEAGTGYVATVLWRLALAGKVAAGVASDEIVAKELSLIGIQRPVSPSEIGGVEWFRFGEFAGWIVEP